MIITGITSRITDDITKAISEGMFPAEIIVPGEIYVIAQNGDNMITTTSLPGFPDFIITSNSV